MDQPVAITASDKLNRQIIQMLQEDGRLPYKEIGRRLGVSEGTIRGRVKAMRESGLLRILGVADPIALGYTAYAMLGLKLTSGYAPNEVAAHFHDAEPVTYILEVGGRFDLLVEVICATHEDLRNFIAINCYKDESIGSVEVMMGLAMHKNLLKWGMP